MKILRKILSPLFSFIDHKIVTPITKIIIRTTSSLDKSSKKLEKLLSKTNTLLFISLFLSIITFIIVDKKILLYTDNTAEVLKNQEVKVIYNEEKYVVEGLPETVDITLIGSKTDLYIARQSSAHYVTIDLSGLKPGTHKVNVQYNQNNSSIDYNVNPSTVTVVIQDKVSETRTMTVDLLNQDSLDNKLSVENINYTTDKVVIKGSAKQLDQVVEVKALVDLNNLPEQKVGTYTLSNVALKAYDVNGEVVDVEIVPNTIDVDVEISSPSKELSIKVVPIGEVANNYAISSISSSQTKVMVYGDNETLNNLKSIPVKIDVTDLKEDKTYKVEIEKPVGVRSLSVNNLSITVTLGTIASRKIENVSIEPRNLADGYTVQGMNQAATQVTVNLKGVSDVINNIQSDDVKAYIDLKGYTEGEYEVEVKTEGTDNKIQYTSMTKKVKVKITKK